MLITGISHDTFKAIVAKVSAESYEGNVIVKPDYTVLSDNRFRAGHKVANSRGPGARGTWSGRRGPYACWHTTRDILRGVFETNPNARVQTALVTYKGSEDFEAKFPDTYWHNAGSMVNPVAFGELCEH